MFFENVKKAPKDAIFGLNEAYLADKREDKVYLAVGIYMDEHLNKPTMKAVQHAQNKIVNEENVANYLPVAGDATFINEYAKLIFGKDLYDFYRDRLCGFQTVGGTSALRIGADFIFQEVGKKIYFPDPTWPNHYPIFQRAHLEIEEYPYYDLATNSVKAQALINSFANLPEKSVLLFHICCHNPTGCDLTEDEWRGIAKIIKEKKHLPFFDFAYMGFNKGIEKDRFPLELFLEAEIEFLVAASCSKSFSLYCQRVGALYVFSSNSKEKENVQSQIGKIIRANYSNPPAFGAHVVSTILKDPKLRQEWEEELNSMRYRIESMREKFAKGLMEKAKHRDFSPILDHRGMFSYCAISLEDVDQLIKEYGIYTVMQGRVNVCGLNDNNLPYVIDSMIKIADK